MRPAAPVSSTTRRSGSLMPAAGRNALCPSSHTACRILDLTVDHLLLLVSNPFGNVPHSPAPVQGSCHPPTRRISHKLAKFGAVRTGAHQPRGGAAVLVARVGRRSVSVACP